tara:strand:- start:5244 stop:5564 length:321 start_codon:yes stop_codon:yes gene_type:complete
MNKIFIREIVEAIYDINSIQGETNDVENFVNSQISKSPDFMSFGVKFLSWAFNHSFLFLYLKSYENLQRKKQSEILIHIKKNKTPIFSIVLRFYESLVVLRAVEKE